MDEILEKKLFLYNILYVIFRKKFALIILCTFSFLLVIFFTFLTTPLYQATAKIWIRQNPQQQLILFRDLTTPAEEVTRINPANDLIEILASREIAQEVVEKFSLDERIRKKLEKPEETRDIIKAFILNRIDYLKTFAQDLGLLQKKPRNLFAKAIDDFMESAQDIQLEEDTNIISLSIWEETPKLSSDIANYMAQLLIEKSTGLEQTDARNAYDFTKQQLEAAEKTLRNSEDELLKFRKNNKIISLEAEKRAKLDELHAVETEYINVKSELSEAQARLKEIQREISAQQKLLLNSPILANNPVMRELIISLNNAEIQLAGDLEKFTESSKNVTSLRARASEGRNKIEKELNAIIQSSTATLHALHPDLPNEYILLVANVAALDAKKNVLQKEMDTLRAQAFSLSVKEIELERLNRRKKSDEELHKILLDKFSELEVEKASHMSGYDLKIIDKAFVPEDAKPDRPDWFMVLTLGLLGSMILSLGIVFFIEYWDDSFKSANEIEDRLGLPVLCTVADLNIAKKR